VRTLSKYRGQLRDHRGDVPMASSSFVGFEPATSKLSGSPACSVAIGWRDLRRLRE